MSKIDLVDKLELIATELSNLRSDFYRICKLKGYDRNGLCLDCEDRRLNVNRRVRNYRSRQRRLDV